jgi:hypothetical protein
LDEDFLDDLAKLEGGPEARDAIRTFLDKYGMRCVGEIDITRPSERPKMIMVSPGAGGWFAEQFVGQGGHRCEGEDGFHRKLEQIGDTQ